MFINLRNIARYKLGSSPLLIQLYKLKKKNRTLITGKKNHLCIEAYPRTANTFSVLLVERCSINPITIAHHMHSSAQIVLAKKYQVPLVILIRNPIDSILSNLIRDKGMSINTALNWYENFYLRVIQTNVPIQVWKFETITNDPEKCLIALNRLMGYEYDFNNFDKEEIFTQIKELAKGEKRTGKIEDYMAIPNDNRKEYKESLKVKIENEFAEEIKKLNRIYSQILKFEDVV